MMLFEKTLKSFRKKEDCQISKSKENSKEKDRINKEGCETKRKQRERNKDRAEQFTKEHESKFIPILEQIRDNFVDTKLTHHIGGGLTYGSDNALLYARYELAWQLPSGIYWGLIRFAYYPDGKITLTAGNETFGPFFESDASWQEKCQDLILKAIELRAFKIRTQT